MAAETIGMFKEIFFVNDEDVFTSRGKTSEAAGMSRRSSKVKDSFIVSSSIVPSIIMIKPDC
jgi:hypothetical protein